ncbi:hypothetical protein ACTMTF_08275 [Nonomuraea sp. ZG12]|uniref:hypothetical protein n=1 Tax=Nonomuraea sp. ZG12 TaxID=3452207 RepID=UPI003F8B8D67
MLRETAGDTTGLRVLGDSAAVVRSVDINEEITMADEESSVHVRAKDVSVDDEGRVTIDNPEIAQALTALARDLELTPHPGHSGHVANNCFGGNCSMGCAPR